MTSEARSLPHPGRSRASVILALAAAAIGILRALSLRWTCDDAFITFRYVENIARGLGPVYNAGERVEGYSHFLWLGLLSAARSLGINPILASEVLGVLFFAGTILCLSRAIARLFPTGPFVPMAAFAVALHYDLAVWATGGLETALFTFLVAAGLSALSHADGRSARANAAAGLLLTIAVITRPDGALFLLCGLLWLALPSGDGRLNRRSILAYLLPAALILLPYLIWKLAYYGDLLPNPYYAKSGGGAYWAQGFRYIALYIRGYPSSAVFVVALVAAAIPIASRTLARHSQVALLRLCILFTLVYSILFVARVGGDFMYARLLLPIVPLLYLGAEIGARLLFSARPRLLAALLIAVPLFSFVDRAARDAIYFDAQDRPRATYGPGRIADERWYWTHRDGGRSLLESYERIGSALAGGFPGSGARVLLQGQASLGYYAGFDYCLEGAGLTDRAIARKPLQQRGRPGHEKSPSREELIARGIHFLFMKRPMEPDAYRSVYFRIGEERIRAELLTYDREVMRRLAERFEDSIAFFDFESYLDDYLASIDERPSAEVRVDYERFRDFYFRHNDDPEREAAFVRRLAGNAPG